jgi:hypothetical protein
MGKLINILRTKIISEANVFISINEKWSSKYKKSINCKNPKGFSQRAHCQGKRKKLKEQETESINNNEYRYGSVKISEKWVTFRDLDRKFEPTPDKNVVLIGDDGTFEFNTDQVYPTKYGRNEVYLPVSSVFEIKPTSVGKRDKNPFTSKFIKDVLKKAFPSKWFEETDEYSPGLRGIYPYSNNEDWSLLNYFDTNPHRKLELYKEYMKDGSNNPIEWFQEFLINGDDRLKKMLNNQRNAIKKSEINEIKAIERVTKNYKMNPKGHKIDRYDGIDVIDTNTGISYQIKTVSEVKEIVDEDTGEIIFVVIGDRSRIKDYQKKKVDKVLYYSPKSDKSYVFDNQNYEVVNNDLAYHYNEPEIY